MKSRYTLGLAVLLLMTACSNNDKTPAATTDTLKKDTPVAAQPSIRVPIAKENDLIDTLNTLSFVKESSKYIDSISNHKHSLAYIIDTTDTEYTVTAGYNGAERFETYYNFSIDKKTRQIKVQDAISGDMVTPKEFERMRKAANKQ
ncbi:hypothetical protein [Ferruginibacter sp.]